MPGIIYSPIQRAMIYGSYLMRKNSADVAELYQIEFGWTLDRRTVDRIVEKYEKEGIFQNRPGAGRPNKLGDFEREMMIESLGEEHKSLAGAVSDLHRETGKAFCKQTLDNYTSDLHLIFSKPIVKLNYNLNERMNYAEIIAGFNRESLIWEDESFFTLEWQCVPKMWMLADKKLEKTQSDSRTGVHVLGAISLKGSTDLYVLPKGVTWTSQTYISALEQVLLPFCAKFYKTRARYYIHDQASCHKAAQTQCWFQKNEIKSILHPSHSPDIQPIELIWAILKSRVYHNRTFKDEECLAQVIRDEWAKLTLETLKGCISEALFSRLFNEEYMSK